MVDISQTNKLRNTLMVLLLLLAGCSSYPSRYSQDSEMQTQQLIARGFAHYQQQENGKALELYRLALQRLNSATGSTTAADIHFRIGKVLLRQQQYEQALSSYQRALVILQQEGSEGQVGLVLSNMGVVYQLLGRVESAREHFLRTLTIREDIGDRAGEIRTLINLGGTYLAQGRYPQALNYYEQARELSRKSENLEAKTSGSILTHIGSLYSELGQYDKALELHNAALTQYLKHDDATGVATALHNIGYIHSEKHEYPAAIGSYRKSLQARQERDLHGRANTLNNLGLTLADDGQLVIALSTLIEALQIHRELGVAKNIAATLDSIGTVYTRNKEYTQALEHYLESLVIARQIADREGERVTLGNIGLMKEKQGQDDAAIVFYKMAVNISQEMRSELHVLSQQEQRAYADRLENNYRLLADLLISRGRLAEAEQVLTMLKEEEYFEFIRRRTDSAESINTKAAYSSAEAPWTVRYEEINKSLITIGQEYEALLANSDGLTEDENIRLVQLKEDMKIARRAVRIFIAELEDFFLSLAPERAMEFGEKEIKTLRQIQPELSELGAGVVLLTVLVTDTRVRLLLTTPNQQLHRDSAVTREELNDMIVEFRKILQNPRSDPADQGQKLYDLLIQPVVDDLQQAGAKTLLLSLDDTLRYLPFAALYDQEQYLGQRFNLVIYTAAARRHLTAQPIDIWRIAGLGVSERTGTDFSALPAVKQELDRIVREEDVSEDPGIFPGVVRLNSNFTPDQFSADLRQGFPVIHIASHFKFRPGNELDSFLVLGAQQKLTLADIQDGDFPLTGVDLLTLSACETAFGGRDARGKEVESFGVLAQQQGAKAVLATLWPVEDSSTAEFMASFYRLRQEGMTKAAAIRTTQEQFILGEMANDAGSPEDARGARPDAENGPDQLSATIGNYSHPYYWAPFILMGNYL